MRLLDHFQAISNKKELIRSLEVESENEEHSFNGHLYHFWNKYDYSGKIPEIQIQNNKLLAQKKMNMKIY